MEHKMFCYQCQETAGCSGCTQMGVCGKKPEVAAMQDLLVYVSKGLSAVTTQLRKEGTKVSEETNHLITWNLFTTITNANFDNEAIIARIHNTLSVRRTLILQVKDTSGLPEAAFWDIKTKDGSDASDDVLFAKAKEAGVLSTKDEDIRSLRELITYGLKGLSAYSKHANVLLSDDPEIDAFLQRALAATLDDSLTADDLVARRCRICGNIHSGKSHNRCHGAHGNFYRFTNHSILLKLLELSYFLNLLLYIFGLFVTNLLHLLTNISRSPPFVNIVN